MPPCITKRRTTNLKTKNNQNCQKIELYGKSDNEGVKEERFNQTGRRGRDDQPVWRRLVARWKLENWGRRGGDWRTGQSHIRVWINQEEQMRSEKDCAT